MGYKELGRRIQYAREEAGMNQEQLASLIGCSQPALSNFEKGKRRMYLAQLQKIAKVLNKPLDFFIEAMDSPGNGVEHSGKGILSKDVEQTTISIDKEILEIIEALYDLPEDKIKAVKEFILWEHDKLRRNMNDG